MAKVAMPKKASFYQSKAPKVEKMKVEKAIAKSSYRPSPPSSAGDALDLQLKAEIARGFVKSPELADFFGAEVLVKAMRFSFSQVGEAAFGMYSWSPHSATAIAQVKLEQRIVECDDF